MKTNLFFTLRAAVGLCSVPLFTSGESVEEHADDDLRIRGIFDSNLPRVGKKHSLKIILHPHFGDLHRHDHLRVPIGARYGMSETWEISAEVESYFPHGLGNDTGDSTFGVSGFRIGSKARWKVFPNFNWDQAVGFEFFSPISTPPSDITDGLLHFKPYINFARRSNAESESRFFWGIGLDLVQQTPFEGTFQENEIGDNANTLTVGKVWEYERVSYTLEANYSTSRLLGDNDRDLVSIKPGIIWKVPRSYTFNSRGNWILGAGVKVSHGHDGFDYGLSLKVKVNLDFKD